MQFIINRYNAKNNKETDPHYGCLKMVDEQKYSGITNSNYVSYLAYSPV